MAANRYKKISSRVKKTVSLLAGVKIKNRQAFRSAFFSIAHLYFNIKSGNSIFLEDGLCNEMSHVFSIPADYPALMFNECARMLGFILEEDERVFLIIHHQIAAAHLKEYHGSDSDQDMNEFQDLMDKLSDFLARLEKYAAAVLV